MQHIELRHLDVSRIGLGALGMSGSSTGAGSDDAESIRTVHRALDRGVTFLDAAETYGPFRNGELLGRALRGRRDQVALATKFGLVSRTAGTAFGLVSRTAGTATPNEADSSPASIRAAVEGPPRGLDTGHINRPLP
ncbi:aldo/keto reductase [Streptomyces sp. NPDC017448]|uniref:aldo/keto reductase n=1 Tax=Streptomyces sp. NPDC017448 TaxID=3364996 RepID=UPI00378B31C3